LIVNGKKEIEEREIKADGRYLDASKPGIFRRAIKGDGPARRIAL
jgi:hypothetical protein